MNGKKAKMLRRVAEDLTQGRVIGYTKIAKGVPTRMAHDCTGLFTSS